MNRETLINYIHEQYGDEPQFLWEKFKTYAVFRHGHGKWYALLMTVHASKLGIEEDKQVDIVNVKVPSELVGSLRQMSGIFPAYHMNKENWISILLSGRVKDQEIYSLVDESYRLTKSM